MQAGNRRILCAESNRDVGDLIAFMLSRKGYSVTTVQTAADCLKLAATERFDLYVLNDKYVDGDSLELCRELRAMDPHTPVLLFSLDSKDFDRRRAASTAGASVYLSDNSDFSELVGTIDRMLRKL
ncbi:MAG TPA: response regulator [Pyrinomonadaceae bacterium]|nr:response regulator [Pyrinomonadaceae bacterium]